MHSKDEHFLFGAECDRQTQSLRAVIYTGNPRTFLAIRYPSQPAPSAA